MLALSFGVGLSGGRIAVGIAVFVGVALLVVRSDRWTAARDLALMLVGVFVATLVVPTGNQQATVTARVASGGTGGVRRPLWRVAIDAVMERPVLGWGPGNIEIATERQFDLEYTSGQLAGVGSIIRWIDAHNVVLNLLVGMGLVGGALALVFVVLSIRSFLDARRDLLHTALLAGALAMVANWMMQPSTIHTVPIALLLLGASMQSTSRFEGPQVPDEGGEAERSMVAIPARIGERWRWAWSLRRCCCATCSFSTGPSDTGVSTSPTQSPDTATATPSSTTSSRTNTVSRFSIGTATRCSTEQHGSPIGSSSDTPCTMPQASSENSRFRRETSKLRSKLNSERCNSSRGTRRRTVGSSFWRTRSGTTNSMTPACERSAASVLMLARSLTD